MSRSSMTKTKKENKKTNKLNNTKMVTKTHTSVTTTKPVAATTAVVPRRTEVTQTQYKPKLVLSTDFIEKVKCLHEKAPANTEWSGVLLYKDLKGSIDDPTNWEIAIVNLILMDIGTHSYTEYELDETDPYAMDLWMNHLDEGGKLGHIHTHHNMTTFFSGTDMTELHDNAPNHNYYLSLIVNYKHFDSWCAKVAMCGTTKKVGKIEKTLSWKGAVGNLFKREEEEINSEEQVLFLMDCEITTEAPSLIMEEITTRIEEVKALKKARTPIPAITNPYAYTTFSLNPPGYQANKAWSAPSDDSDDLWAQPNAKVKGGPAFGHAKVTPLLVNWLAGEKCKLSLYEAIRLYYTVAKAQENTIEEALMFSFEETFISLASNPNKKLSDLHLHAIANTCYDLLAPYEQYEGFGIIDSALTNFLLEEGKFSKAFVTNSTGLIAIKQTYLKN